MHTADVVHRAARGDQEAWDVLVARFNRLVWWIARDYGLSDADAADAVQATWSRLVEHLDALREPEKVGSWLATTARRECMKTRRASQRVVPTEHDELDVAQHAGPDGHVLINEREALLWHAIDALPERRQRLVRALMADPPPSYEEISDRLDIPVGSIGPTRARCLRQLREQLEAAGVQREPEPAGDGPARPLAPAISATAHAA
jgi:RNA polymerase sigma factor (sigma-70 family)